MSRIITTNGNQSQIKGTAKFADLLESQTDGKMQHIGTPVIGSFWETWNYPVAGIAAEPHRLAA
jgi:hypothetical protein